MVVSDVPKSDDDNFRNAVRRSYVKNLIDGLWHHVAVVNPDGGNHRDLVRMCGRT